MESLGVAIESDGVERLMIGSSCGCVERLRRKW
jgi:hypothetical protein